MGDGMTYSGEPDRTALPVEDIRPIRKVREFVPRIVIVNQVSIQGCKGHKGKADTFRSAFRAGNGQPYERWHENLDSNPQPLCPGCWIERPSMVVVENRGMNEITVSGLGRVPPGRHAQWFPTTTDLSIYAEGENCIAEVHVYP